MFGIHTSVTLLSVPRPRALAVAGALLTLACNGGEGTSDSNATLTTQVTTFTTVPTEASGPSSQGTATTTSTSSSSSDGGSGGEASGPGDKLDLGDDVELPGCDSVDILFVIDNSASMATYQDALADAFPGFVDAIFSKLPSGVDLHVGLTTTDFFCNGDECACPDSTIGCQSAAEFETIKMHYTPPTDGSNGINGSQGRLFTYDGLSYFETSTDADPTALKSWFTAAATAAGELGCSFEMPVAAASYLAHPANAMTNEGFIRDEDAVLLLFFLTDEPDKSPEPMTLYRQTLLDAKSECGGEACIITAGLVPSCIGGINQKLWQMMTAFGEDEPIWGDIKDTDAYTEVIGAALAATLEDTCAHLPEG